jgi:hypothetical protein
VTPRPASEQRDMRLLLAGMATMGLMTSFALPTFPGFASIEKAAFAVADALLAAEAAHAAAPPATEGA